MPAHTTAAGRFSAQPWVREVLAEVLRMDRVWRAEVRRMGVTTAERGRIRRRLGKLIAVARRHEDGQTLAAAVVREGISISTLHRWLRAVRQGPAGLSDRYFAGGRWSKHAARDLLVEAARLESLALEATQLIGRGVAAADLPTMLSRGGASVTARSVGAPIEEIAAGVALMVVRGLKVKDLPCTADCPARLGRALLHPDNKAASLLGFHAGRIIKSGLVALGGRP